MLIESYYKRFTPLDDEGKRQGRRSNNPVIHPNTKRAIRPSWNSCTWIGVRPLKGSFDLRNWCGERKASMEVCIRDVRGSEGCE